MYQALYRKYRPKTFDDVVGQDVIVRTLKMPLSTIKLVMHIYLLALVVVVKHQLLKYLLN